MRTLLCLSAIAALSATAAHAATVSRSLDVKGAPKAVWAMIGPFCAIKDWHPVIGACTEDGKTPPTRTLVTKDGKATFVETRTRFSDARRTYTYAIVSSPLPLTRYSSTLKVVAKGKGMSTITWSSTFTPDEGKAKEAEAAVVGIYESGLAGIKDKLAK
jgi:hypothetical protein